MSWWPTSPRRQVPPRTTRRPARLRPGVEALEDRRVPATYTVTSTSDLGAGVGLTGDLRYCILQANASVGVPDVIQFAIPGTGVQTIHVTSDLPVITDPLTIDGYTQPGSSPNTLAAGDNAALTVELDGSNAGQQANGLVIATSDCLVRGLVINRFAGPGILVTGSVETSASGNVIAGNFIGTDPAGASARGNGGDGVLIDGGTDNTVGGTAPADRNVLSGNGINGVRLVQGSTGNVIAGNFIGTDAGGTAAVGNAGSGVVLFSTGGANTVGGTTPGAGNVISGNLLNGVAIDGRFDTAAGTVVAGNLIGTDVHGTAGLGNGGDGVVVGTNATEVTVGGTDPGAGNVISANGGAGIHVQFGGGTLIQGNRIGTDLGGTRPLGNAGDGIFFEGGSVGNTVGGATPGAGNTVAFNAGNGVTVGNSVEDDSNGNAISRNALFDNGGLGIDLADDGVTANDPGDADSGPNELQNFPVITSADAVPGGLRLRGTLASTPGSDYTLEFFANADGDPSGFGEGQAFLGDTAVTTDALGNADFDVTFATPLHPPLVTATATDADLNTSEFSPAVAVLYPAPATPPAPASPADLANDAGILRVAGAPGEVVRVQFRFLSRSAVFLDEVGVIVLDARGRLDGLRPTDPGFLRHALASSRHHVLFRRGQGPGTRTTLTLHGGDRLLIYLVQNDTTDALASSNPDDLLTQRPLAFFSSRAVNPDGISHARLRARGPDRFLLFWEDMDGGGDRDFNDVVMSIRLLRARV